MLAGLHRICIKTLSDGRCYEENEEVAAYLMDISVNVKKFPPSFSIDEGSSTDPEKNLKCEVFSVSTLDNFRVCNTF